jgi:hypothetical protein
VGLIRLGNLPLEGSSYKTGDVAFTPFKLQDSQHSRANTDSNSSYNMHFKRNKTLFALSKRELSPAKHFMEGTSHRTRPKKKSGDASFFKLSLLLKGSFS